MGWIRTSDCIASVVHLPGWVCWCNRVIYISACTPVGPFNMGYRTNEGCVHVLQI